ncbi:MAG: hypothetical protein GTN35_03610 [Nitrososphaeria archaeon]|nr:hypothetical protein [Nitrosopumilaceae archaeon]NIP10106.1 hypothetical protein [Nitrosopumilaceae archaeon]NIP91470.1 hypothetical protein [Nitrososphaeria archaeon]NIS95305.1 hypothetical protein [Nitrosopumilaceae archaeon]
MELNHSQKLALGFGGCFIVAGLVLSTLVFPFWNFIREDVYEDVVILNNDDGVCYVETQDNVPKTIENCSLKQGDKATIKFGEGLAWATIVEP